MVPRAWKEIKALPGNVRQRVKRTIDGLADEPRSPKTKELEVSHLPESGVELRRLRLENWRIVYAITEADKAVDVLGIRKRPPYDYGDLGQLLQELLR